MKRKTQLSLSKIKSSCGAYISETKGRLAAFLIITILCFIAGIVIFCTNKSLYLGNENIVSIGGIKTGLSAFFSRSVSIFAVLGISFVSSLNPFTSIIGVIVVGFRGYLLGYNICLLCSKFGMSGLMQTLFIIIPCQVLILFIMVAFLAIISKLNANCKKFGSKSASRGKVFAIFLLVCLVINVIETVLLSIFSSSIILVI